MNPKPKLKIMNNYDKYKQDQSVSTVMAIIIITISLLMACLADNF